MKAQAGGTRGGATRLAKGVYKSKATEYGTNGKPLAKFKVTETATPKRGYGINYSPVGSKKTTKKRGR